MNFDFSEDVTTMRGEVRRVLQDRFPNGAVRRQIDAGTPFDRGFWRELGEMGWLGVAMPEVHGGSDLGYEALCMIAEEMGAALAPAPFASSIYFAAEALLMFGSAAQQARWLPGIAAGETVGTVTIAEGIGDPRAGGIATVAGKDGLSGVKLPVIDGDIADFAIVAAKSAKGEPALWLVDMTAKGVTRTPLESLDSVRRSVRLVLADVAAEPLPGGQSWAAIERLLDRVAVLLAFEQVGGAQAALDMAVGYAQERFAFGRPIASFQAIKHKLADVYVATELARSNAYFGAWAIANDAAELPTAAAAARIAATDAFSLAAQENLHTHGGMGFTWESDCHLYYRRARELAVVAGSPRYWRHRLIRRLDAQNHG